MAGVPLVKLEHKVNGSWLDVTSRLYWSDSGTPLEIQRGVAEDGGPLVGTGVFTLDNSDGALTTRRPASPHYPYLVRYRPVRFSAFIDGSWVYRHYGFLDSERITFGNESATDCRVTWSTIDHFGMAALKPLRSVAVEVTAAKSPLAYWPLTDTDTSASDQSAYPRPALVETQYKTGGEIGWASGRILTTELDGGVVFTPESDGGIYLLSEDTIDLPASWALTVLITPGTKDGYVVQVGTAAYSLGLWYDTSTKKLSAIETKLDSSGDPIDYVLATTSATFPAFGVEHMTVTPTSVDLYTGTTGTRHGGGTMKGASVSVGGAFAVESGRQRMFSGEIKHLALWSGTSPAVYDDIVTGPSVMYTMESAIERVLAWSGLGTVVANTQGTNQPVVMQKIDGLSALDVIANYSLGSLARIFCAGDGTITVSAFDYIPAAVTAPAWMVGTEIEWAANPTGNVTDAVMTWPDGSAYTATEDAVYRSQVDLPGVLKSDAGKSVAEWVVLAQAEPGFPLAPFDLLTIPDASVPDLALLECGSILTIPNLPAQLPSTTQTGVVDAITETIGADSWSLRVTTDSDSRSTIGIVGDTTRGVLGAGYVAGPLGPSTASGGEWKSGDLLTHTNLNARDFPGGMMQAGSLVVTPVANTPTSQAVTFPFAFPSTPTVVASPATTAPGSEVKEVSVVGASTTGFTVWVYRTNTTALTVYWVAAVN